MKELSEIFDYIVVGAGSAGAVVANRLSADPQARVCLVEAGPEGGRALIDLPIGTMFLMRHDRLNWRYRSAPQAGLNGRVIPIPRGKTLGGTSAMNGMAYVRGHPGDYDEWAAAGCEGWTWDEVKPFFLRSERNTAPDLDDAWHGRDGELYVSDLRSPNPLSLALIEAGRLLQYPIRRDFNGPDMTGLGLYQVTQRKGRRWSTARAFIDPVRGRSNLTVLTDYEARRIVFDGRRAVGVALRGADGTRVVGARREIVLSAGAIGSPEILLRSGIGPAEELRPLGIDIVADLPGVGRNLHDHPNIRIFSRTRSRASYGVSWPVLPRIAVDMVRYLTTRRGMFTSNTVEAGGFERTGGDDPRPDIQYTLLSAYKSPRGRLLEWGHGLTMSVAVMRPKSRGALTLDPADPEARPVIDLGAMKDDEDVEAMIRGLRRARRMLETAPFAPHGLTEVLPGPGLTSDDDLADYVRSHGDTIFHPAGSCAMGVGPDAVVSPRLAVRGIGGLRVADISIMPTIVGGNTNAPAVMIGERVSDMIIQDGARA